MNPAIQIKNITKSFGTGQKSKKVLNDISLKIKQGEVFGFLGPNGAGKSTTIKLLLRFIRPDSGSLKILGQNIKEKEYRHQLGYCAEFPFFYDHLTAWETLLLSGRLSGITKKQVEKKSATLLEKMNLQDVANQRVGGFSKGMKQRLGMANALIHDPPLLVFDEPMSGLDPIGRHLIKNLMIDLRAQGKTIFFSSHILSDIEELCDQIGLINKGILLYSGSLDKFTSKGQSLEACFIKSIEEADHGQHA